MPSANAYPAHEERDVVLRSGSTLRLRPIRPDDAGALLAFYERLSPDSLYFRFFSLRHVNAAAAASFCASTTTSQFALVGDAGGRSSRSRNISGFRSIPSGPRSPSPSRTRCRGRGSARACSSGSPRSRAADGIRSFEADVLTQNRRMLDVFATAASRAQESATAE